VGGRIYYLSVEGPYTNGVPETGDLHLNVNPSISVNDNFAESFTLSCSLWTCQPSPGGGTRPTASAKPPSCRKGALTRCGVTGPFRTLRSDVG